MIAAMEAGMLTDSERNYTGTNTAVITMIVLLAMVVSYMIIAQARDAADDRVTETQRAAVIR